MLKYLQILHFADAGRPLLSLGPLFRPYASVFGNPLPPQGCNFCGCALTGKKLYRAITIWHNATLNLGGRGVFMIFFCEIDVLIFF